MASLGRVVQACERCRKQKLKCDATRPCTLCMRASAECKPRQVLGKRKAVQDAPPRETVVPFPAESNNHPLELEYSSRSNPLERRTTEDLIPASSPTEQQQFGANSSVINFARNVARDHDLESPDLSSTIPGDAGDIREIGLAWSLRGMQMPPLPIMRSLIQAYFDRVQWFIFLFHEPSFVARVESVLRKPQWTRQDLPVVVIALTVAAMGLKCVLHDASWHGHAHLEMEGLNSRLLLADFISEIRTHMMDLVDDGQIETVQVCLILGTYYIYNGSAHAAWSILSMAVSTAYALALHCESPLDDQNVELQVRRRTWNHVIIADTFSSMIYGRPAGLDAAFARVQPLCEMDDTAINGPVSRSGDETSSHGARSTLAFHVLKYRVYSITKHALSTLRLLRLNNPLSEEDANSLLDTIRQTEHQLADWHSQRPDYLTMEYYNHGLRDTDGSQPLQSQTSPPTNQSDRILMLQAITLQATYDSSVIFLRRPLIEHRLNLNGATGTATSASEYREKSLDIAIEAALRISRLPLGELEHHLVLSFVFMHFFTAGVILCIVPPTEPFSARSQECKAGVMRIIRTGRAHGNSSKMAKHLDELLTPLLSATIQRELNNALDPQSVSLNAESVGQSARIQHDELSAAAPQRSDEFLLDQSNQFQPTPNFVANDGMPPPTREQLHHQFSHDLSQPGFQTPALAQVGNSEFQFDAHLDETFGAFGQSKSIPLLQPFLFGLLPSAMRPSRSTCGLPEF